MTLFFIPEQACECLVIIYNISRSLISATRSTEQLSSAIRSCKPLRPLRNVIFATNITGLDAYKTFHFSFFFLIFRFTEK